MIKLCPNPEQYQGLLETMARFNEGCNYTSGKAFATATYGQFQLHHIVYCYLREHYKLSAQMPVKAVAQVLESYHVDRKVQHSFNPRSAMVCDQRILSWKGLDRVSILTLRGRQIIPTRIGTYQQARIDRG